MIVSLDNPKTCTWKAATSALLRAAETGLYVRMVAVVGAPGSGKSYWCRGHDADDVLLFDCCQSTRRVRAQVVWVAHHVGMPVDCTYMSTPIRVAIERIKGRDRHVPSDVVERYYRQLKREPPHIGEGYRAITLA